MKDDLRERIIRYRVAAAVLSELVSQGLVSPAEKTVIDTKLLEKYGLNSYSIFS